MGWFQPPNIRGKEFNPLQLGGIQCWLIWIQTWWDKLLQTTMTFYNNNILWSEFFDYCIFMSQLQYLLKGLVVFLVCQSSLLKAIEA